MLDTIPQDQTFTQLIITQMVTYYDKCFGLYKGTSFSVLQNNRPANNPSIGY